MYRGSNAVGTTSDSYGVIYIAIAWLRPRIGTLLSILAKNRDRIVYLQPDFFANGHPPGTNGKSKPYFEM